MHQNPVKRLETLRRRMARQAPGDYRRLRVVPLPASRSALACFEFGDPNGRPLLCLHGLSISGLAFEQYHERFAALGLRAIAPCLLGGVYDAEAAKTPDRLASELIELLEVLGVGRFDLMGFSWGTLPALDLLARIPARIGKAGLLGPMLPVDFLGGAELARLKPDVGLSLRMARQWPRLHRVLMGLVCRLPLAVLVNQFRDDRLSAPEAEALQPGHGFREQLARCLDECRRSGSRFFTSGWRMFSDRPGYALGDLAAAADVDLRLYVGEQDNVHLPDFACRIAAACAGADAAALMAQAAAGLPPTAGRAVFQPLLARGKASVWMAPGAGRMACMLYFGQALEQLMSDGVH